MDQQCPLIQLDEPLFGLERKQGVGPHPGDGAVGKSELGHRSRRSGDFRFFTNLIIGLGRLCSGTIVFLDNVFQRRDLSFI